MSYLKYVDVRQGTKSLPRFSNGNTLPLTQLPFAMASFAPQTNGGRGNWFYHPEDRSVEGIRLTHQPSPWLGDYGSFMFLPQMGNPCVETDLRWSSYRTGEATLRPDYIDLKLLRPRCRVLVTPTERGGGVRLKFEQVENNWVSFFTVGGENSWKWDKEKNQLLFTTTHHNPLDDLVNFKMYTVIEFKGAIVDEKVLCGCSTGTLNKQNEINENNGSIHLPIKGDTVEFQIAISYISFEQALFNLNSELGDFDTLKQKATDIWEEHLMRIEVECENEDKYKTFYTCLYRTFLFPHKAYELNEKGEAIHYTPCDGTIKKGVRYTDNGFWDTFRTVYPLFAIIARKEYEEMLEGFINDYCDRGWLPRWLTLGEVNCMPSTLIDAVIADAAVKGIGSKELLSKGFEGMLKHATMEAEDPRDGRHGVLSYLKYGYVPYEEQRESVNLTLDAAYGDFCIAQLAKVLGKTDIEKEYRIRALNYKNLFDSKTGFMRPKNKEGNFREEFSPFMWGRDYTEAGPWQTSFFVPHDMEGLAALYGSKEKLLSKIDELFSTKPLFDVIGYGAEIHEMSEMASVDFGQCAISNQPSFHIPFLYAMLGEAEKTNYWVKKICDELISWQPDGLPGDEDNGTMAAWYIFANLGLYPFCPAKPEYVKSKMLVKSAKINGVEWTNEDKPPIIDYSLLPVK